MGRGFGWAPISLIRATASQSGAGRRRWHLTAAQARRRRRQRRLDFGRIKPTRQTATKLVGLNLATLIITRLACNSACASYQVIELARLAGRMNETRSRLSFDRISSYLDGEIHLSGSASSFSAPAGPPPSPLPPTSGRDHFSI
jgi:hypothetical protein